MLVTNTHQVALGIHELGEDDLANENRAPDMLFSIHYGSQFLLQLLDVPSLLCLLLTILFFSV